MLSFGPALLGVRGDDGARQEEAEGLFENEGPGDIQVEDELAADEEPRLQGKEDLLGADGGDIGPFLERLPRGVLSRHHRRERKLESPLPSPGRRGVAEGRPDLVSLRDLLGVHGVSIISVRRPAGNPRRGDSRGEFYGRALTGTG